MNRITTTVWACAALLGAACTTDPPASPGTDTTDAIGDSAADGLADGETTKVDSLSDSDVAGSEVDATLKDAEVSLPDVPSTACVGGCEEGETCLSGNCVASCGDVPLSELTTALAPGIDAVGNICVDTGAVWAWQVGLDGALYEVRALSNGANTDMSLTQWNWWEGAESAAAATVLDSAVAQGSVELWEVFPGRFLDLSDGYLLWGYAVGANGGEIRQVAVDGSELLQVPTPGVYGAAQFSQLLLATSNGVQTTQTGPGGYYYHLVHQLGGPILSGLGTSVGTIQVHNNDVLLASGYSNGWADCGGEIPIEPEVGQRTYALSIPLLAALFSNSELPIDLLCNAQVVDVPTEFTMLSDGRIATASTDAAFNVAGLSVTYWTMSTEAQFLKGNSIPITEGATFSELRADPHSTKLLLRHANGYLVVEGPPTQDPVLPVTPVEPDPGPEVEPDAAPDAAADVPMGSDAGFDAGVDAGSELSASPN